MGRGLGMLAGLAVVVLVFGTHPALADVLSSAARGHRAPAPLLAAGIPAFVALGGGVLFSRVFRRAKRRD